MWKSQFGWMIMKYPCKQDKFSRFDTFCNTLASKKTNSFLIDTNEGRIYTRCTVKLVKALLFTYTVFITTFLGKNCQHCLTTTHHRGFCRFTEENFNCILTMYLISCNKSWYIFWVYQLTSETIIVTSTQYFDAPQVSGRSSNLIIFTLDSNIWHVHVTWRRIFYLTR